MRKLVFTVLAVFAFVLIADNELFAQCDCEAGTNTIEIDLSDNPDQTFTFSGEKRNNYCCGSVSPRHCIRFNVTLHPQAEEFAFDVTNPGPGAPENAFYWIDCKGPDGTSSTAYDLVNPICVNGTTSFCVIYCKPGGDQADYTFTSGRVTEGGPDLILNAGCSGYAWGKGFDEASVVWTSVGPGAEPDGTYNYLLTPPSGSDSVLIEAPEPWIGLEYIDFEISGPATGCSSGTSKDTIRVFFLENSLSVLIDPQEPVICFGSGGVGLTANATGGSGPYTYSWSRTGVEDYSTLSTTNANQTVNYWVEVWDTSNCKAASDTVTVTEYLAEVEVNAGDDIYVCSSTPTDTLDGEILVASGGEWSGGTGIFVPNRFDPKAEYTPSAAEITSPLGYVELTLTSDNESCGQASDAMRIYFNYNPIAAAWSNGPVCTGNTLNLFGSPAGMTSYAWSGPDSYSNANQNPTVSGAATVAMDGVYTITVTDGNGCTDSETVDVTINTSPVATASDNGPICAENSLDLTGGPGGMTLYNWEGPLGYSNATQSPSVSGSATVAMSGTYTLTVTDVNLCTSTATTNAVVNPLPVATASSNSPVCVGAELTLTGGNDPANSYSWEGPNGFSSTDQSPIVAASATLTMDGVYNVTVTDGNGCTSTASTVVVVNPLPVATATSNTPVCVGSSLDLTGGPGAMTIYAWEGPNGYSNATQSPNVSGSATLAMAGTYTITVTDANTCTSTASTVVVVNPLPVATATSNTPVCVGSSLDLTGGPGAMTIYAWEGPGGYSNATQSPNVSASATLAMAGTYTITVTDANTCTSTASTVVVVNPLPVATASSNTPVCVGSSLDLTGGPGAMTIYAWEGPGGYSNATQSPNVSGSATLVMAGTYTLTVTDANTCTSTASTVVVVNPLPAATAASNSPVCTGSSLILTGGVNGLNTYAWSGPNGYNNATQSPTVSGAATVAMAGDYVITVTDANGCTDTETTTVAVNVAPVATASSNTPVCVNSPLSLTGGPVGMATYEWTGPAAYSSFVRSPLVNASATLAMAGDYTLLVTHPNGCTDTEVTTVVVNALPVATATSNTPVCEGSTLSLTGGPGAMVSYIWEGPDGFSNATQSPTVSTATTLAMAGTYTITVTDGNTCTNTASTLVVVNPLPVATASSNTPVCVGSSLDLTGGPGAMTIYAWEGPSGYSNATQSPTVSGSATLAMAGTYTITVTDGNACTNSASTVVVVNALPVATAGSNSPVCVNSPLTLSGGPAAMTSYSWEGPNVYSNATQSPTVSGSATIAMAGTYTITVTDANTCTNTASTVVIINALPVATASSNTPVCVGSSLELTGGPGAMTTYSWEGPDTYSNSTQSPVVSASATSAMAGPYGLTVTDANGCTSSASTIVVVNTLPIATTGSNSPVCAGEALTLTGGPAGMTSYNWAGPLAYSSTTQNPTVSGSATTTMSGVYTLTIVNGNGCSDTETVNVTVNALPVATATSNSAVCVGESLSLTGGPALMTNYSWSGPNGYFNGTQSPVVSASAILAMDGIYTITVTDGNGCTDTETTDVTINTSPTANAGGNVVICLGGSAQVGGSPTASGGDGSYSYSWDNGLAAIANPNASPAATTTYTVVVTDGNSCSDTDDVLVTVNPEPTVTAGNNHSICAGDSYQLIEASFGGAATSVTWTSPTSPDGSAFDDDTDINATYTPTQADIDAQSVVLTVTTNDPAGPCTPASATMTLNIIPIDDPSFSYASGTYCQSGTDPTPVVTGLPGGTFSEVTGNVVFADAIGTVDLSASALGTWNIQYETNGTCTDTKVFSFTITSAPDATFSYAGPYCQGDPNPVPSIVPPASAGVFSANPAGLIFEDSGTGEIDLVNSVDGAYTITNDINVAGCAPATFNQPLTINPGAIVDAGNDTTICSGSTFTLGATLGASATSVTWFSPTGGGFDNPNSLTATYTPTLADIAAQSVVLTVTTDDPTGPCIATSDDITISINPAATVSAGLPQTICEGETATLSGSFGGGATGITWTSPTSPTGSAFDDQNKLDAVYTPTSDDISNGSVTLTITTDNPAGPCGAVSATVEITINPATLVYAGTDKTICADKTISLTEATFGGGTTSVLWTSPTNPAGDAFSNNTDINATYTPTPDDITNGSVLLTVSSNDPAGPCGVTTSSMTLNINPSPVAAAASNSPVCEGNTISLTGGPAAMSGYSWAGPNGYANGTQNPTVSGSADLLMGGTYTITVTDGNGCTDTETTTVVVNVTPVATASSNSPVCVGKALTLTSGPGGMNSYSWSGPLAYGSALQNPTVDASATTAMAGLYTVTVTHANGCTATESANVVVNTLPTASAAASTPVCVGNTLTLTGGPAGMSGYTWSGPDSYTNNTASPTVSGSATLAMAGIYTITVTNANGCTDTETVNVTVNPLPVASASNSSPLCVGESLELTGGPAGMTLYSWTGPNGFSESIASPVVDASAQLSMNGVYTLVVTDVNGCTDSEVTTGIIYDNPTAEAGNDKTICSGKSVTVGGTPTATGGTSPYSYAWDNGLTAVANPVSSALSTTVYNITVTDTHGCTGTDFMTVNVNESPSADAGSDLDICFGGSTVIGATPVGSSGTPPLTYVWNNASTLNNASFENPTATPAVTTTYTVTVTDILGCTDTDPVTVTVNDLPVADAGSNKTICFGESIQIGASPAGFGGLAPYTYAWDNSSTLDDTTLSNPITSTTDTLLYNLIVTDANGCTASDFMLVYVNPLAEVDAGTPDTICAGETVSLLGSVGGGANTITWSSATGTDFNDPSLLNAVYTPNSTDIAANEVVLTITTNDPAGPCPLASDDVTIVIEEAPVIEAGSDFVICENESYTFTDASFGGSASSITWSSPSGNNFDNANLLLATYTPTPGDIASGSLYLTITTDDPAGNCTAISDSMQLVIDPAPVVNAGPDSTICEGMDFTLSGSMGGSATSITWSSATGSDFDNPLLLNATYTPNAADILASKAILVISSNDPAGPCGVVTDTIEITIEPTPTVEAGTDETICAGETVLLSGSMGGTASSVIWTSPTNPAGDSFGSQNSESTNYTPTSDDINAGSVTLTITTDDPVGYCLAVSDSMVLTIDMAAEVYAGIDSAICEGDSYQLQGTMAGTTTSVLWSSSTSPAGTAFDDETSLTAIYTPTPADITAGSFELVLSSDDPAGPCGIVTDTIQVIIQPAPTVYAGPDTVICANSSYTITDATIGGTASSQEWSTSGNGTFDNSLLLNPTYTPSADDIANGFVKLYLTTDDPVGSCTPVTDSTFITITDPVYVSAGDDFIACKNDPVVTLNGSVTGETTTGLWSSSGTGAFSSATDFSATYTPSSADTTSGSVQIILESTNSQCATAYDTLTINYTDGPFVDAGIADTVCANNSDIVLNGVVAGNTVTGIWTTSGTGTFSPNDSSLTATYLPSAADTSLGTVTLVLTSTNHGSCIASVDSVTEIITDAPVVLAGPDQEVCSNNPVVSLGASIFGGASAGVWTSSGTGFFSSDTDLFASYTPSDADTAAGTVFLYLTTTDHNNCSAVEDTVIITIGNGIVVDAGADEVICANNNNVELSGLVSGYSTTGQWSSSGTGTFDNENELITVYHPSPADTVAGSINLYLISMNNGLCLAVEDTMVVTIDTGIVVNAGSDQVLCSNNALTTLSGDVSGKTTTGYWATLGSGTFIGDSTNLSIQYLPSSGDTASGFVDLVLVSTNNDLCQAVFDTVHVDLTDAPLVDAGGDYFACRNNAVVTLSGMVSGGSSSGGWLTMGTGTFAPDTSDFAAVYTASDADTTGADFVRLVLVSTNNGTCLAVSDTALFNFTQQPLADAGIDAVICATNDVILNGTITGGAGTGQWTTSGTGIFVPHADSLNAIYEPSDADTLAGFVTLVLESTNTGGCLPENDTLEVTITPAPFVEAGSDISVCANNSDVNLSGTVWGATSTGRWSTPGTGVFVPHDSSLVATYLPSDEDTLLGDFPIYLSSTNHGSCIPAVDSVMITITTPPTALAGDDILVCKGNSAELSGTIYGGASSGRWSSLGTGTFSPDPDSLSVTYTPSDADTLGNFVTIVLESTNNGQCLAAYDTVIINLSVLPNVDAGSDLSLCANNADAVLVANVSGSSTTGLWTTSGTGTFIPNDSTILATYIPSEEDTASGAVVLTLNATYACPTADSMNLVITPAPYVNAGADQSVCIDVATIALEGTVYGATNTAEWTTLGLGIFNPDETTLNATYIRSAADSIAGEVSLVLTSTNHGNCLAVSDTLNIDFSLLPAVNAGSDFTYCSNNADILLGGNVQSETNTGVWSSLGSGSFSPAATTLNAIYSPSEADTASGYVTLVLTSTNSCIVVTDTVSYVLTPAPYVNAGSDLTSCSNNTSVFLSGIVAAATTTGKWYTSGDGIFFPNNQDLNAVYNPGPSDLITGTVSLELISTNNGMCFPVRDTLEVEIVDAPLVSAGLDQYICTDETVTLEGSVTGITTTGNWLSSGSGTFNPDASTLGAVYIPSDADTAFGEVTLILTSSNNGACNAVSDPMTIYITPTPLVYAGQDQYVCSNNIDIQLTGQVSGSTTTGYWQSMGGGTFTPDSTAQNAAFNFDQEDIDAGGVNLVLVSSFACKNTDTVFIEIYPGPAVDAGEDQYFCDEVPVVVLNGSIGGAASQGVWETSGSGYFDPNATTLNATYYPSTADTIAGEVTLTLSTTDHGDCIAENTSMTAYFKPQPTVDAGPDLTVCANNEADLDGSIVNGTGTGFWSTDGTGFFFPGSTYLFANYLFSQDDTANAVPLEFVLTSDAFGNCLAISDTLNVTITPAPYVDAGDDVTVCSNNDAVNLNGIVSGASTEGFWTTTGNGIFTPDSLDLNAVYMPGDSDLVQQTVYLVLHSRNIGDCWEVTDTVELTLINAPVVAAGTDQFVCTGNDVQLNGSVEGITSTGIWTTDGTGTFSPDETDLTAVYTPSALDTLNGVVTFVLQSTNYGLCLVTSDTMIATITAAPFVEAGSDTTMCGNNANLTLNGIVGGTTTTGLWLSSGSGYFSPDSVTLGAIYIPSSADTAFGNVVLTLQSTNACLIEDSIQMQITEAPYVYAGEDQIICVDQYSVDLEAVIAGATTTGEWSTTGTGIFAPNIQDLSPTYFISQDDSIASQVDLVLVSTNHGNCIAEDDTVHITITTVPQVIAGPEMVVCANTEAELNGQVIGGSGTGYWLTTGTGTFTPSADSLNVTYNLSAGDTTFGAVKLILVSSESCLEIRDTVEVEITPAPFVDAYTLDAICANNTEINLNGIVTIAGGAEWSSLTNGIFSPGITDLNPVYTFSETDTASQMAVFILTSTDNGDCNAVADTLVVNMTPRPQVYAGPDELACFDDPSIALIGSIAGGASEGVWTTSGTGVFSPNNTLLHSIYIPSVQDTMSGLVTITLTSTNNGTCFAESDSLEITWEIPPYVNAGQDQANCPGDTVYLNGIVSGVTTTGAWSTAGDGELLNSTQLNAAYIPGTIDAQNGTVDIYLASTGACASVFDTVTIEVYPKPIAQFQTSIVCSERTAYFTNLSSVTGDSIISYTWTFGDGDGDTILNPVHLYDTAGVYSVRLTVETASGCTHARVHSVSVTDVLLGFELLNTCINAGPVDFNDTTIIVNDSLVGWSWNFGDGYGDTLSSPSHQYDTAGEYTVELVIFSENGCNDTLQETVSVASVQASLNLSGTCLNDTVFFTDVSIANNDTIVSWAWDFGDGTTDTLQNPDHLYSDSTNFTVSLVALSAGGCNDTVTQAVSLSSVLADFSYSGICEYDVNTSFTDISSVINDTITSWQWEFGDGEHDNVQNTQHQYPDTGVYQVDLIVVTANNCTDTATYNLAKIFVNSGFSYTGSCNSSDVTFSDTSQVLNDQMLSWEWTFGDGDASNDQNPQHMFDTVGEYLVSLITISEKGCTDTTSSLISLDFFNADFVVSGLCYSDTGVVFTDISYPGNDSIIGWQWNFGDGVTDTLQNVVHLFDSVGIYTVQLIISSDSGCVDTTSQSVILRAVAAGFDYTGNCNLSDGVSFSDTSIAVNDSVVGWSWSFGDLATDTMQNPYHTYGDPGLFEIEFIVETQSGCIDTVKDTIPLIVLAVDYGYLTDCNLDSVVFADSTFIEYDSIMSWNWDFGDSQYSSAQNPAHLFDTSGTYSVKLEVETILGCIDSVVYNVPINVFRADFSYSNVCMKDNGVTFFDNSIADNDSIETWSWDFGDGNTSALENPVNQFTTFDVYTVTMVISSTNSCIDTISKDIRLSDVEADFLFDGSCANDSIQFIDSATVVYDSVVSWFWDFGDGFTDTLQNPKYIFGGPGTYEVVLIEETNRGCDDSVTILLTVNPVPVADFEIDNTSPRQNQPINITDLSTGAVSWLYEFGDGKGQSTLAEPSYTYIGPDITYTVIQTVTNEFGCVDTASAQVSPKGMAPPVLPTAFSPNGDGHNDILKARGGPFTSYELKVYNDWGKLVFESNDADLGWDGTYKGKIQPVGVYVYILNIETADGLPIRLSGDITLIR